METSNENKYPKRTLIPEEIAWAVLVNRIGVENALNETGFITSEDELDERLVRVIYDNQMHAILNGKVLALLSESPYKRGCIHCAEAVKEIVNRASRIF